MLGKCVGSAVVINNKSDDWNVAQTDVWGKRNPVGGWDYL